MSAPLETTALGRRYGRLVALDDLSVTVAAGECVALIGANGSGKSTAVRAIAGLLEPSEGTVRVCGVDPHREPDAEQARAALALVPDTPLLYDDLTVRQHLELVTLSHGVVDDDVDDAHQLAARAPEPGGTRGVPPARAVARHAPEDPARLRAHPAGVRAGARRAGRRAGPAVAVAPARAADASVSGAAPRCCSPPIRSTFGDGLADRAVRLEEGVVVDEGPWERRARASGGGRMDLAVAAAGRAACGGSRAVRQWWRVQHPPPSVRQRLDVVYTIAITAAIVGALAYGTAGSALAQVRDAGPARRARARPRCSSRWCRRCAGAPTTGRWSSPRADVAFLLGAPS